MATTLETEGAIYSARYKIFDGQFWNVYYFETSAALVGETNNRKFLNKNHTINGKSLFDNNTIILTGNDIKYSESETLASKILSISNSLGSYATKSELDNYAKTGDLNNYVQTSVLTDYQTKQITGLTIGTTEATTVEQALSMLNIGLGNKLNTLDFNNQIKNYETVANADNIRTRIKALEDSTSNLTGAFVFQGSLDSIDKLPTASTSNKGYVYIIQNQEYVSDGSEWILLGDEGSYVLKTTYQEHLETQSQFNQRLSGYFDGNGVANNAANAAFSTNATYASSAKYLTDSNNVNLSIGSAAKPVYFNGGVPVACTYELNATVPVNAKFTDTTYSSLTAAENGSQVSLVTTGEKYTWNNKVNTSDIIDFKPIFCAPSQTEPTTNKVGAIWIEFDL